MNKIAVDIFDNKSHQMLKILSADGGEGRFVGGCVRDFILKKPYYDIDIATTHLPEKVIELCQAENLKTIPTGLDHGTVTVLIKDIPFEITTLRKDVSCDGRHAEIEYTDSWKEDASRRDFTINSLYMDINGNIFDYCGGRQDLKNKVVRFIGDAKQRINEDYLRILRMFRFQAIYSNEFTLPMQLEICAANLDGIIELSGERIQAEMLKIFSAPKPRYVLAAMNKIGVFKYIIPDVNEELNLDILKELRRLEQTSNVIDAINPYIRLATILMLGYNTQDHIIALAQRWKLSSDDRNFLNVILNQDHHIRSDMDQAQAKKEIRTLTKEYFISTCILRWAVECHFSPDNRDNIDIAYTQLITLAQEWKIPIMPIRGRDLLDLGIGEGTEIGALLKKAEDMWESNDYRSTREELLALVAQ